MLTFVAYSGFWMIEVIKIINSPEYGALSSEKSGSKVTVP